MNTYYNMCHDIDRYADSSRIAIHWMNQVGDQQILTYQQLKEKSDELAKGFVEQGLQKGDRVMILLSRIPEAYVTYMACLKAGLVLLPGSEMLQISDINYRLSHAHVKAVIADESLVDRVNKAMDGLNSVTHRIVYGAAESWISLNRIVGDPNTVLPQTKADDIAFISYTSGTTGGPKGVIHHHQWAVAHQETTKYWLDIQDGDRVWATAGPGWAKWIWSPFISTLGAGATAFVYHGSFQAETYLTLLQDQKINVLCCTPTEYRLMAKTEQLNRFDLSPLRSAVSAGEPLNREVIDTFKKYFKVTVRDGYGQTENTLLVATLKDMEPKAGSMGKPTPSNRVSLVDDEGNEVPQGTVGHIAVHESSPALFKGYYLDDERTKAAFRGDWYLTGDRARMDEEGYFWFEGRSDDIIISSGYTIGPFEVEDALVKHPKVKECAVVASPDPIRGSIVKAFVVLKENIPSSDELVTELQNHTKVVTAPYKYPREIEFVNQLPKTTSGKIRRIELREMEKARKQSMS
ncbi:acyl-CoA synthetase [Hazenella coriacea]|uniref:Acetyl-CoA synthetase n=1 Tax=Hazenella coriacea TaxID=1179467 RepID=A0A4R3L5H7_9BACL|nr:acyl--CoA ligase [Hazenella coriacea]TCS94943.1 acetyl-CoA synthetase [Hazenella coriacea]